MVSRTVPHWLPTHSDLEAAFSALKTTRDPAARLDRIIELAAYQLDFVQTGKLDRMLAKTLAETTKPHALQPIRLAWLGSSTVEHLLPSARIACVRQGLLLESYLAPYGQYRQELLDPGSELARFKPHAVLLALDHVELAVDMALVATADDVEAVLRQRVGELRQLWSIISDKLAAVPIQQTVPNLAPTLFGSFDNLVPGSPYAVADRLHRLVLEVAAQARTPVLDVAGWANRTGHAAWFDPIRWLQAKQLVAPDAAPLYGDLVARLLAAIRGRARKCLVLDLDNTLWGGVVGDDGVERLVLGQGSAAGEAYLAFQRYVQQLKHRGVVLAVCSKNEQTIAQSAFTLHPDMVLKLDDFGVFFANWNDKASNLRQIADALNLGLDSLVFFDDNPAERAIVRAELPMVAVPEVPEEPAYYVATLADAGYFESVSFTADDLSRAQQYQDNGRRQQELASATDMTSFLSGLKMTLQIGSIDTQSIVRVTQLINKTNQFNVTTRRYTEPEVRAFAERDRNLTLHFRLVDRFGDNGLIAVLLARASEPRRWVIDTLLMSCRVLGRGVEQTIMNVLVERAIQHDIVEIVGEYLPTAKNAMVSDLFGRLGFTRLAEDLGVPNASRWLLRTKEYVPQPTFIEIGVAR